MLALVGTAACDPRWDQGEKDRQQALGGQHVCQDELSDPDVLHAQRDADKALRKALRKGAPDPVGLARRAADSGDFRLVGALTGEGVSTSIYGAQCRLRGGVASRAVRILTFTGGEADDPQEPGYRARAEKFARTYNAAMLADERYPYADICRPLEGEPDLVDEEKSETSAPGQGFGFADLGPLHSSPTLAEVAS